MQKSFEIVGLNYEDYVQISEKYYRPNEVNHLLGDSSKIREQLGWEPKHDFPQLVKMMVENDIKEAEKEMELLKIGLISPTWEYPVV